MLVLLWLVSVAESDGGYDLDDTNSTLCGRSHADLPLKMSGRRPEAPNASTCSVHLGAMATKNVEVEMLRAQTFGLVLVDSVEFELFHPLIV